MATIWDVAKYITQQTGEVSAMKLQKLMYYAQAWNLVWEEQPLFSEDFEAWANGPVLPSLYARHRKMFQVNSSLFTDGDCDQVSFAQKANIDKVLGFYGKQTAQWLSNVTHLENPWRDARGDTPIGAASSVKIEKAAMHEYYSSL